MIAATTFAGKTVAVFGMGMSGLSAARSLLAGGAQVVCWDDGEAGRVAAMGAELPLQDLREIDWTSISALVLAPGVPLTHPTPHWSVLLAQRFGVEVFGDTEIFCRERRTSGTSARLIAITGTNGKSTTAALTHHLLRAAGADAELGGNIGRAVLDLPNFTDGKTYVLELSSFQLDLTPGLDADAAALLNITPDHLDRHGTIENYAAVKAKVFAGLRDGGVAVIGADDAYCDDIANGISHRDDVRVLRVSATKAVKDGVSGLNGNLERTEDGVIKDIADVRGIASLRGSHNWENAAAAMVLASSTGGHDWYTIAAGLRTFPGLAHRMEEIRRIGPVIFINDSKATNADAAARALASFDTIYWIAGGKAKDGGIESLAPYFEKIRKAYLIGDATDAFALTLNGKVAATLSHTLEAAIREAYRDAMADRHAEAVVLLSPACASYDQFKNFEARGNAFRDIVESLPKSIAGLAA